MIPMAKAQQKKPYEVHPDPFQKWSPVDSTAIYKELRSVADWAARARTLSPKTLRWLTNDLHSSVVAIMVAMRKEYRSPRIPQKKAELLEVVLERCDTTISILQTCADVNAVSGQFFDVMASGLRSIVENATRMQNAELGRIQHNDVDNQSQVERGISQYPTEQTGKAVPVGVGANSGHTTQVGKGCTGCTAAL